MSNKVPREDKGDSSPTTKDGKDNNVEIQAQGDKGQGGENEQSKDAPKDPKKSSRANEDASQLEPGHADDDGADVGSGDAKNLGGALSKKKPGKPPRKRKLDPQPDLAPINRAVSEVDGHGIVSPVPSRPSLPMSLPPPSPPLPSQVPIGPPNKRAGISSTTAANESVKSKKRSDKENKGCRQKRKSEEAGDGIREKHRKVLGSQPPLTAPAGLAASPSVSLLQPLTDCDPAIKATLSLLRSENWGEEWEKTVTAWLQFEGTHGFNGCSRILSTNRPVVIAAWIRCARSSTYKPRLNVNNMEHDFWAWWAALQPDWRVIQAGTTARDVLGDWAALDKPGANGWPSIVASLFYWRLELEWLKRRKGIWPHGQLLSTTSLGCLNSLIAVMQPECE